MKFLLLLYGDESRWDGVALRWAAKVPAVAEGSVEVRPVMDYEAYGYDQPDAERA